MILNKEGRADSRFYRVCEAIVEASWLMYVPGHGVLLPCLHYWVCTLRF